MRFLLSEIWLFTVGNEPFRFTQQTLFITLP